MEAESKETNSSSVLLAHEEEQEEFLGWAQRVTPRCEAYKQWVERDYALKINALAVPPAVLRGLPIGDAQLLDVRIGYPPKKRKNNRNKKRNLPYEDEVYASSERIRQKVARGNCLLSFKLRSSPSSPPLLCFPLRGLKKFTGGMGDDDDCPDGGDEEVWRKFFTKPPEQAKKVVSTWKANGAAAHLSVIKLSSSSSASTKGENKLQTKFLLIGGSKNVHLMAGTRGDLSLYDDKENRLSVALKVMHALFDMLEALNHQQEDGDEKAKEGEDGERQWNGKALRLLEFMARKHWTACFEMLDPEDQHVECLDHLRKPFMQFITFVPEHQGMDEKADNNSGEEDGKKKGLCVEPTAAIQFAAKMGFETVKYEVFELEDPTKIYHVMNEVRTLHGTEGRVLYFLDEEVYLLLLHSYLISLFFFAFIFGLSFFLLLTKIFNRIM
ncbi:RNA-directed RNA polymerase [Balamuthia mandrillaris]